MTPVSAVRLHLLRAGYLLLVIGLGLEVWPRILSHPPTWALMNGVVASLLGAMGLLAVIGLRHPLRMLPLLLFELTWKSIWLLAVALPLWSAHRLDPASDETAAECLVAVIFLPLIPWRHVVETYVTGPGRDWRTSGPESGKPGFVSVRPRYPHRPLLDLDPPFHAAPESYDLAPGLRRGERCL